MEKNNANGVRGVGHGNIFFSPDRSEMYYVYHARTADDDAPSITPKDVSAFSVK